ncbi:MAG: DUF4097 family beta strand repeat-containing protein [Gammaproteobacteria bacterium]|nr:DUF4097 family beta strand repeat-containing protein [Gammaproteobacteria bacterium]
MRKAHACTASVVVALMATGAMAETEQRSFEAAAGGRFVLDADWGKVEVETWDRDAVDVSVERTDELESLEFDEQEGTVTVRARKKERGIFGWFRSDNAPLFQITVPRRFDLDLTTAGGKIGIADIHGEVAARTAGGSLEIGEVAGSVHGRTAGGSIRIDDATGAVDAGTSGGTIRIGRVGGPVHARTTGGSIHIDDAHGSVSARTTGGSIRLGEVGGTLDAKTTGGSVRATLVRQPEGDSSLRTTGGSIDLALAEDIKLTVDARTTGGGVSSDLPASAPVSESKSALVTAVNGGGPKLTLRTTGGSIRLRTP